MCGGRYVGFSRCAFSDMWVSADVRSSICEFKQMCGGRYAGLSRCAVADMWVSADVRCQICGFQQMCFTIHPVPIEVRWLCQCVNAKHWLRGFASLSDSHSSAWNAKRCPWTLRDLRSDHKGLHSASVSNSLHKQPLASLKTLLIVYDHSRVIIHNLTVKHLKH